LEDAPDELAVCKFVLLFIPRLAGRTGELATFENEAVIGANGTDRNPKRRQELVSQNN
jgi:hypothetical protein